MRLFILAAGIGSRLFPLTKNTPKSLLDFGDGTTLLERQIENAIQSQHIDEVVIITGYKYEQIDAKIKFFQNNIKISTVFNPFYDVSNNLVSLWCVTHLMEYEDFVITNGDNIYKAHVYDQVINTSDDATIQLTIDYKDNYDDDDMKVLLFSDTSVKRVHKDIAPSCSMAESVGLVVVRGDKKRPLFIKKINDLVKDKSYLDRYWLEIFNSLIGDGLRVVTETIDKDDWREMDFHPDMEEIKKSMLNKLL